MRKLMISALMLSTVVAVAPAAAQHGGYHNDRGAVAWNRGGPSRQAINELLRDLQHSTGVSLLFISHDLTAVKEISHRVAIMYLGEIVEVAGTADLFSRQLHPYGLALLAKQVIALRHRHELSSTIDALLWGHLFCVSL